MNYDESLVWLDETAKTVTKPGLSRIFELLELIGNPQDKLKFVHIAGTNGKGSVSACIAQVLYEAGYNTGLYTSPHLMRINERLKVNDAEIEDEEFAGLITKVRAAVCNMREEPNQFDVLTAAAFEFFYNKGCDIVVLETGLGGRLDSTNIIKSPEVAVITKVDMDHIKELGNTIEKIAAEKAGIIKPNTEIIVDGRNTAVMQIFKAACIKNNCRLNVSEPDKIKNLNTGLNYSSFSYKELSDIKLRLLGLYQPGNAVLAVEVLKLLIKKGFRISNDNIKNGLFNVKWQARFELLSRHPCFIIDGSYNPAVIRETLKSLNAYFPNKKVRFILGILSDKNIAEIIGDIKNFACEIAVIAPPSTKACETSGMLEMIKAVSDVKAEEFENIAEAVKYILDSAVKEDIICATGSLYSVAEIRKQFTAHKDSQKSRQ